MLAVCAEKTESWKIADGAVYTSISRPDEPYEIRVIRVLREKKDIVVDMVMANDSVRGLEWVRTAAERMEKTGRKVIAGVNGDFYFMSNHEKAGLPLGPSVSGGKLYTSGTMRGAFYIAGDGIPRIGTLTFEGFVESQGKKIPLNFFNWENSSRNARKIVLPDQTKGDHATLFTHDWKWAIPYSGVRVRLDRPVSGTGGSWAGHVSGVFRADETVSGDPHEIVLVGTGGKQSPINALEGRVTISFGFRECKQPVRTALGSWEVLLRDGKILPPDHPKAARHPRTMIGFNEKELFFVTVDGRRKGWSKGMRSVDQARLLKELGCTEGCNIDGGGSTTAWVRGNCVNRPSDGHMRRNANAVLISTDRELPPLDRPLVLPPPREGKKQSPGSAG